MESTGSCTGSTAPAAAHTSLPSLAISGEGNKLPQQSPSSSRAPSSASDNNKKLKEMIPEFKCEYCPCTFTTKRGRGGHLKAHRNLPQVREKKIEKERQVRQKKIEKERRRLAPVMPQVRVSSSLSHFPGLRTTSYFDFHAQLFNSHYFLAGTSLAGVVPLFAGTGTGGLAPAQVGNLREVNQGETAHGIHNFPSLRRGTMPMFLSQMGSGTSGLAPPSFATPGPAAEGRGGTADGVRLGRQQQDKPQVNQEETTDGIDLTLRL